MISRRRLLLVLAALGGGAAAYQLPWQRFAQLPAANWFTKGTGLGSVPDAVLLELHDTRLVAQAWLAQQADAPGLEQLAASIASRLGSAADLATARSRLAAAVLADYAEGRTCDIEGWELSQTECEAAALRWLAFGAALPPGAVANATSTEEAPPEIGQIVEITAWGPQETEQGEKFNVQPDGHSGIWIAAEGAHSWIVALIDGREANTTVLESVITTGLYGAEQDRILGTPGSYSLALYDPMQRILQPVGELVVRPRAERALRADGSRSMSFCPVEAWGPDSTVAGVADNVQPDGSMGLWFRLACAPRRLELLFGEDPLPATRVEFGATATVPLALLQVPGTLAIRLRDRDGGEELTVGEFTILPRAE